MTPDLVLSPLDVLIASTLHHYVKMTPVGVACDRCRRVMDAEGWSEPCPGLELVMTQRLSIGPLGEEG